MRSLYEKKPENWDKLARFGYPEFRELAKHFSRNVDFDEALNPDGRKLSSHWGSGNNMPSMKSIEAARKLLEKIQGEQMKKNAPDLWIADTQVEVNAPPSLPDATQMILIAGPKASLKKLENISKMLGCEVVDV